MITAAQRLLAIKATREKFSQAGEGILDVSPGDRQAGADFPWETPPFSFQIYYHHWLRRSGKLQVKTTNFGGPAQEKRHWTSSRSMLILMLIRHLL